MIAACITLCPEVQLGEGVTTLVGDGESAHAYVAVGQTSILATLSTTYRYTSLIDQNIGLLPSIITVVSP